MAKSIKTNAARLLDQAQISYHLLTYEVDPEDLAAESTADKVNLEPERVFKTLVIRGDQTGILLAVIPGNYQLDLKALARLSRNRKVETVALKEVQSLTGYIRGGVTALACKKPYPVYVDETIQAFESVTVSAGNRGVLILLDPADYLNVTNGTIGCISVPK